MTHYMQSAYDGLVPVPETHTRTSTDDGPDYCAECAEASLGWVTWPCEWSWSYDHRRCGNDGLGCSAPVADYDLDCNRLSTGEKGSSAPSQGVTE